MVAAVNFMLCVVAFLLAACVIVPLAALAILAVLHRKEGRGDGREPGLSLPPANGVR